MASPLTVSQDPKKMNFHKCNLQTLTFVTRMLANRELRFVLPLVFANYTYLRLKRLLEMQLRLRSVPDMAFQIALSLVPQQNNYVDSYCCVLVSKEIVRNEIASWYYICCTSSLKKYKVLLATSSNVLPDEILMSETMLYNVQNHLNISADLETDRYFIIAASDPEVGIAEETSVSLISNPFDCPEDLLDSLLRNYFSSARYVRLNDILSIEIRRFALGHQFLISQNNCKFLHFKISDLKVFDKLSQNPKKGCFVVQGVTSLLQKSNLYSYLPRRNLLAAHGPREKSLNPHEFLSNCPPCLEEPLKSLIDCISPFVQTDSSVDLRPVFLLEGVKGSGKSTLVRITAETRGLNFLNVDFSEIQSLTSAQTEAKLRIVLHNAKNCVPCILLLSNIQIFGKDAEGKEDERIISSFGIELKNFFNKIHSSFPLIVIATADSSPILPSLRQVFIETIKMQNLTQSQRSESLKWLLESKGFETEAELSQIASICTDFVLADLTALVLHAAKIRAQLFYSTGKKEEASQSLMLQEEDFSKAHEYMQSRYSDWIGAPRVPKVNWEDIGGLGELKSEIMRRIELPLLTSDSLGLRRSGLLLYGPPGTGKTLLAKAVATECRVHFLSVKGPELLNMYVGQSEKNVRQVFDIARSSAPCVIFFDELDSLAPNRGRSGDSGGVMDRVVSQLLAEIDGIDSSGSVFIIGATNRPDLIDPALLRPGRFDKLLYVGISSEKSSKLSILKAQTRRFDLLENGMELNEVVDVLPDNLTGADIYAVCSNAWLLAVRRKLTNGKNEVQYVDDSVTEGTKVSDKVIVTKDDFIKAMRHVVPSVTKEELKRYEKLRSELSPVV